MLYADEAGIVSRSSEGLEMMMAVLVTSCSVFGTQVSKAKTEIMCLQTKGGGKVSSTMNAVGHVYKQKIGFVYLGWAIAADKDVGIEITFVVREPERAFSGTRWKSVIARVCVYG